MIQSKLQKQWDYNSTPMNCDFTFLSEQPEHNSQSQQNLHLYHDQTSFNLPDVAATPLDLAIEKLRQLSRENHQISQSIHNLRSHPKLYLNPVRNQIVQKINQMKQENQKLRIMIDKAKSQPGYAEMTKKKSTCVSPWRRKIDQDFDGRSSIGRGAGSSIRIVRSVRDANQSDDTEGDNQKYQTSTYLNCKTDYIEDSIQGQQFRRFKVLEEMKGNEQVRRRHLIDQLHIGLQKYQIFKQELEQLQNKSAAQNCQNKQSKQNGNQKQMVIEKIQKEKKNLMKILKSLRKRERQIANLVETYRKIHAQTSERFEQAVRMLQQLQCLQSSQEVDQQYAQVIQLQERLADLDEKIKQIDEQKIFEQIQDELKEALNRAGVNIGQWNILSSTGRVARIDQICRIFLEFMGYENKQNKKKIAQVQQYFQAQKQNHQSTLNQLKKKQQYLAKRLLQLQTNKH